MSFTNITSPIGGQTANLPLGLLIQIAFSNGIRNQISTDFRDYEMVKRAKVGNSLARELRFMFPHETPSFMILEAIRYLLAKQNE